MPTCGSCRFAIQEGCSATLRAAAATSLSNPGHSSDSLAAVMAEGSSGDEAVKRRYMSCSNC